MSHRARLKGVRKNRGKNRNKPVEHRLPWEEAIPPTPKAEEQAR